MKLLTTRVPARLLAAALLSTALSTTSPAASHLAAPSHERVVQTRDPCALLTTAEVQRAFPSSKAGRLDRTQEKSGIVSCVWEYPTGVLSIIGGDGAEESVKDEARGWTDIFLDPLRQDAARHVRYEPLPGVGDEAIAILEREDKTKGFARSGAILVLRRGKKQVSMLSSDLAHRERAEALKVLADFGKAIAKRLE